MRENVTKFVLLIAVLVLGACAQSEGERTPPPIEDTAFGDMTQTMDKARAVEDLTMQHKEELDRRLQDSEQ